MLATMDSSFSSQSKLLGVTSALVFLVACGSSHDSKNCAVAEAAGQSVFVDCAEIIQVDELGDGFRQQPPTGSKCDGASSYTIDLSMRKLHWSNCDQSVPLWMPRSGDHSLSQSEYDTLIAALKKVVITASTTSCGADKPTITLSVDTGTSKQTYHDSFYACTGTGKPYVDNIDGVLSLLFPLAKP